ncbi:MAG TPA: type II toxin-antitoxin system RelE/ParE family toxin [Candidatus Binataceae bacterium]|nr:type II toxin-antitoxin system RelE/ParE family toxin [Candidatus Binataceae bacterium]
MPKTQVVFYRKADGTVPVLEWFDSLPPKAQDKCRVRIQRGWPNSDTNCAGRKRAFCRDGIHELRVGLQHMNYRILYFFRGRVAAVLAHGLTKEDRVPEAAIETALTRKQRYEKDPKLHTFEES